MFINPLPLNFRGQPVWWLRFLTAGRHDQPRRTRGKHSKLGNCPMGAKFLRSSRNVNPVLRVVKNHMSRKPLTQVMEGLYHNSCSANGIFNTYFYRTCIKIRYNAHSSEITGGQQLRTAHEDNL